MKLDKCRICLEFKNKLFSVFQTENGISYADMLISIAKVKIVENASQNNLCTQCRRKLRKLYYFKKEIERSDMEINQHSKILKFNNNIDEVKAQLMQEIGDYRKNITIDKNVDFISLLENDYETVFYWNTTITKIDSYDNCIETKNDDILDLHLNYETDNECVERRDLVTCDYRPLKRQKIEQKRRRVKNKDVRKSKKFYSNLKNVCIKPIILDDIRIMPTRRKSSKLHKGHKYMKRLDMCPHCGIMTSNMKSHVMVHIGERKFKCSECSKAFFTSKLLSYHQQKHFGIGEFKCDHCVAVFNNKTSLRSHMVKHIEEKSQVCPICNKGFKRKSSLLRHQLIHNSSAKSIKCELCNMSFLHKQGLRHHMRVHTGERPFKCEICCQPYSYKHDFNRHCLKKHGVFLKQRSVHVLNENVLMRERALMKDLMLRVHGVVKEGEPLNPFQGPHAALAFDEAVKALGSYQIPIDITL